jgi:galactose mutarotase-like enzyme
VRRKLQFTERTRTVMAQHNWVLTDVEKNVWRENFSVSANRDLQLSGSKDWLIRKSTLRGGLSDGVDVVVLDNGRLSLSIVPTRGMGIWRGTCDGLELGWKSPVALPVHPAFVDAQDRGGIGWLAGFNEWICRCGLSSNGPPSFQGTQLDATLHGKVANLPAHFVEASIVTDGPGTLSVTGLVDEASMFGPNLRLRSTVQTIAGSNRFVIVDEITNRGGTPGELQLLYHINTGRPFLEPGARCVAPILEVAPRDKRAAEGIDHFDACAAPVPGYAEQVYYYELAADAHKNTIALLRNAHGDKGISLHFTRRDLPCFTLWKNTQSEEEGYVAGLEPATNFPNLKSFERKQGRVVSLAPGATYTTRLEIAVHGTAEEVAAVETQIARMQTGETPLIHKTPQAKWSPPPASPG